MCMMDTEKERKELVRGETEGDRGKNGGGRGEDGEE